MDNRTKNAARIAMLGLLFGWFCSGCNKRVAVPSDCQRFLDQFFQAVKSNDVGRLQEFSFPERAMDLIEAPPEAGVLMREEHKKMAETQLEKMRQMFGDFETYSVVDVKVNPLTAADLEFVRAQLESVKAQEAKDFSAGTHAAILCKAKFSKLSGRFDFELIKKTPESEYLYESYRFEAQ